ncbi:TPA: hypothetical protein ACPVYN_002430 [Vibrio parahaemolyticus]|uniref:hypothetical protein n=1 Tax=Vibrio parahaemolyticus TaxID=670 RepID=UPI0004A42A51|nr:hypothetical protein [Vibrio parahaemolyticus]
MNKFRTSSSLLNAIIKTKVKSIFLSNNGTAYKIDQKWLEQVTDRLTFTFMARFMASGENIDLDDEEFIDECIKAIVFQISQNIERSTPKTN